jgi:hypothetical protein
VLWIQAAGLLTFTVDGFSLARKTEISTVTGANNLIVLGLRFFSARSSPVGYMDVLRLRIY